MRPNGESELAGHVVALRRRKWIVVVAVVVATLGAAFFASREAKSFESGSRVFVNPSAQLTTGATGTAAEAQARYLSTEAALAHTREVAAAAVRSTPGFASPSELLVDTAVTADPESNILTITVANGDPGKAVTLANAYARAFQRESAAAGVANIEKGINGVNRQIAEIKRHIVGAKRVGVSASALRSQLSGLIKVQPETDPAQAGAAEIGERRATRLHRPPGQTKRRIGRCPWGRRRPGHWFLHRVLG